MEKINTLEKLTTEAYKSENFDECLEITKKILKRDSTNAMALQHAARIYTNRQQRDLSKPLWLKLTKVTPDAPEPFLQSARIARLEKDWPACTKYIERFISLKPDHPESLNIQIHCYLQTKNAELIGPAFSTLLRVDPRGLATLARRAVQLGMGKEVAMPLRKFADSGNQDSINLCGTLARAERDAAIGYEIQRNPFSAAECYRTMRIYDPDSSYPTTSLARLRKPFLKRARAAYSASDYETAIEHANTCIEIEPQEPEPYIIASRCSTQLEQHQEAFDYISKEIELLWDHSWLVINYARAAIRVGKSEIAYSAYQSVAKRDDTISQKYAEECSKQLTRLPIVVNQEVRKLLDAGKFMDAYEKCHGIQKIRMGNEDFPALLERVRNLGQRKLRDLFDTGDSQVLENAKALVRLDPTAEYAYRVAGRVLLYNRSYADALYYWEQLVKIDADNIEFRLNVARCYQNLGNKAEANTATLALLKLDSNHEEGKQILAYAS